MKDHIIDEQEQYKAIVLWGFDYKLFEENEGGDNREVLDGYPYLNHLIQLWSGDWVNHMSKMNEAVGTKNCLTMYRAGKRIVCTFRR